MGWSRKDREAANTLVMTADLLEINGWDSVYIGANTPTRSILQGIREFEPDVVGLSATVESRT